MAYFPMILVELVLSSFSDPIIEEFISDGEKVKNIKYNSISLFDFSFQKPCPEMSSSFLSRLTFWWYNGMIITGYKRPLTSNDMWGLTKINTSEEIVKKFETTWLPHVRKEQTEALRKSLETGEKISPKVGVLIPIMKTFWPTMLFILIIKFIASLMTFVNPIVLDWLIAFINNKDEPTWKGYFYASLMFVSPMIESFLNNQYEFGIQTIGMRVRACLISSIYKKVKSEKFCFPKNLK